MLVKRTGFIPWGLKWIAHTSCWMFEIWCYHLSHLDDYYLRNTTCLSTGLAISFKCAMVYRKNGTRIPVRLKFHQNRRISYLHPNQNKIKCISILTIAHAQSPLYPRLVPCDVTRLLGTGWLNCVRDSMPHVVNWYPSAYFNTKQITTD